jgi:putative addiction module component (TIGR02574 family)
MNKTLLSELFHLSPSERIQLAEDLWDSVSANEQDLPPLTESQRVELQRRLADHRSDPKSAVPWAAVRERLWARLR